MGLCLLVWQPPSAEVIFLFLYSLTDWKHMKQQRSEIDERALSSLWSLSASKAMEAIFLDVPHVWKLKGG